MVSRALSMVLLTILVVSIAGTALSIYSVYSYREPKPRILGNATEVVLKLVNLTKHRIEKVLELAESYGIELPDSLKERLDKVYELLANATVLASEDPRKAMAMVMRASKMFTPIARYIYQNLPEEVKEKLRIEKFIHVIDQRLELISRIEEFLEKLKEKGFAVPETVYGILEKVKEKLVEAKELLSSGNYSYREIAKLIASANRDLGRVLLFLYTYVKGIHARVEKALHSLNKFVRALIKVERAINVSLSSIEAGDLEKAKRILIGISKWINKTSHNLGIVVEMLRKKGVGGNLTEIIAKLHSYVEELSVCISQAVEYLEKGDTAKAIEKLREALDLYESKIKTLAPGIRAMHRDLVFVESFLSRALHEVKKGIVRGAKKVLEGIAKTIHRIEVVVKRSYRAWREGNLTSEDLKKILERAEDILVKLYEKLIKMNPKPKKLMDRIEKLIVWIEIVERKL